MERMYGFPAPMPFGIDFVTYSNEDLGVTTAYSGGVDSFQIAMPYPSSMNLWEETMMVFAMEFIQHQSGFAKTGTAELGGNTIHLSMLDDTFGGNWGGNMTDADDEAWKSKFAGPMYAGMVGANITATAAVEGVYRPFDTQVIAKYYPPEPLDLVTPLFITYTNTFNNITLATNATVQDDDADETENTTLRVWFLKRDYSRIELQFLQRLPTRFQQLDS